MPYVNCAEWIDLYFSVREVIAIRGKYIHADFDYNTFNYDIALLKLEKEVNLNIFPPVCLPSVRLDEADIPVWITGIGEIYVRLVLLSQTYSRLGTPGGRFI